MKASTSYPCSTSHARIQEVSNDLPIRDAKDRGEIGRTKSTRIRQQDATFCARCHGGEESEPRKKRDGPRIKALIGADPEVSNAVDATRGKESVKRLCNYTLRAYSSSSPTGM